MGDQVSACARASGSTSANSSPQKSAGVLRIGAPTTDAQCIAQAPKSLTPGHIAVAVVIRFTASERFRDRNVYLSALVGAVALTVPEFQ